MVKGKKCSKCNLPYPSHRCEVGCKCIKRNCCTCPMEEKKEVKPYSWKCPCEKKECQDTWNVIVKTLDKEEVAKSEPDDSSDSDDDTPRIFHCSCHKVIFQGACSSCSKCGIMRCKKCILLTGVPEGIELDSDEDSDDEGENVCENCLVVFYEGRLQNKIDKRERYSREETILKDKIKELRRNIEIYLV